MLRFFAGLGVLFLVLLIVGSVGATVWWLWHPAQAEAQAHFLVKDPRPQWFSANQAAAPVSEREIIRHRETIVAMVKSMTVLNATLANPSVANTMLTGAESPLDWLTEHLVVEFEGDSELMVVELAGPPEHAEDYRVIVDAVCQSFSDEVVLKQRFERGRERDTLISITQKLREEIIQKIADLEKAKSEGADLAQLEVRQLDIEMLKDSYINLQKRVESSDIELLQEDRSIELIEPAYLVSP